MTERPSDHLRLRTQPSFLEPLVANKRVVVCCGAGGVGKTTTSAALGLAGALAGRRVLVLTIDPARRLAEAMGIPETSRAPARIDPERLARAGADGAGELHAWMLNPAVVFEGMVRRLTTDEARVQQILDNVVRDKPYVPLLFNQVGAVSRKEVQGMQPATPVWPTVIAMDRVWLKTG